MVYLGTGSLQERSIFERHAEELQAWVASNAATASWDVRVRGQYQLAIRSAVDKVREEALAKRITWRAAAEQLQQLRNDPLYLMRARSSPVGRALAESLKPSGRTLNELIAKYTLSRFGPNAVFDALTAEQRNLVYADIVSAAARSDVQVDAVMQRIGRISRPLLLLSITISVYEVMTSDQPMKTAAREATMTAGGVAGGIAGGALAGLACGPGAPVCVGIGAFVGGVLAVLGISALW